MQKYFTIKQAAEYLHVNPDTLRRWEKNNIIQPERTAGGHRRYTKEMLDHALNNKSNDEIVPAKLVIGYCRVSSSHQKDDLKRQEKVVTTYCENLGKSFKIIKDQGSGLNYKRPGFKKLIHAIMTKQCDEIVVNYQDRLVRFGFDLIKLITDENNVKLTIINQTQAEDPNQELVDDVLSVIADFSTKLYGKRSHKNAKIIKENTELFTKDN